jgi:hypothetical protein
VQKDLFARVCPTCKGEGRRLISFAVRQAPGIRVRVVPSDEPLKRGDLNILSPSGRKSAIWDTHRLVYRQAQRRGTRANDYEYSRCGRCRGTGHLRADWERTYTRWLIWRGVLRARF